MCFVISFIPATVWAIIGYLVLFSSTRAEGRVQTLGRFLAMWAFFIAVCILLAGAYITFAGICPLDAFVH